jgi:mono/diheme cytochrome c family protein
VHIEIVLTKPLALERALGVLGSGLQTCQGSPHQIRADSDDLNMSTRYAGYGNMRATEDKVTAHLAALNFYQLAIPAPEPPEGSFDKIASVRGAALFKGKAQCAPCHAPPLFTEPGWNTDKAEDAGRDDFQANLQAAGLGRTAEEPPYRIPEIALGKVFERKEERT